MITNFIENLAPSIEKLSAHPLYAQIRSLDELRFFTQRHVFAVFDFMSLAKALQNEFAPSHGIWLPTQSNALTRFINEIILCEESDELPNGETLSHFEMYCRGMEEIGSSSDLVMEFVQMIRVYGLDRALEMDNIPVSASTFMNSTFDLLRKGKIHEIAASFCFGREKCIPVMFDSLLKSMGISTEDAPIFHYYLERHIEVDGDSHGPLALRMIEHLCGNDQQKWREAFMAAQSALESRIAFWDQVSVEMSSMATECVAQPTIQIGAPLIV